MMQLEHKCYWLWRLIMIATILHLRRWSRYRWDVFIWIFGIWVTLLIQYLTAFTFFEATRGEFFDYTKNDIYLFFGIAILSTGLSQCLVHGAVIRLGNVVFRGEFDYWLLQPISLFKRLILEEIGLVWFWPHIVLGVVIITFFSESLPTAIFISILSAIIESCLVFSLCLPSIKWPRWNPEDGLWEYMDKTRSIPVLRSRNAPLIILSAFVIQYSISLEVLLGRMQMYTPILIAIVSVIFTNFLARYFISKYASASS